MSIKKRSLETTKEMILSTIDANGKINFHTLAYKLNGNEKVVLIKKLLNMFGLDIRMNEETEIIELLELPNKQNLVEHFQILLGEREIFKKVMFVNKLTRTEKIKDVNPS